MLGSRTTKTLRQLSQLEELHLLDDLYKGL